MAVQAYDAIIATITVASDASQVVKVMVKSTEWREGTSGSWLTTDCTLNASTTYQFRTPLSGMSNSTTAILPNIKASVTVDWDTTATPISTLGNYFMYAYAFGCSNLTSLSVPDTSGITSVGISFMYAYAYGCSNLTSLSVPDTSGLTSVETNFMYAYAFGCSNLTSLSVPDTSGITSVGISFMYAYAYDCSNLTSLSVPDTSGLTSVGTNFMYAYAFGCSNLTSLSVPDTSGITSVGDGFMYYYARYCSKLISLSVPDTSGLTSVGSSFMCFYADGCSNLTSLSVPDTSGITSVGDYFMNYYAQNCSKLTSLILPDSTGWFGSNNIDWSIPSTRLGYLNGVVSSSSAETAWEGLIDVGETLYTNYIRSVDNVILGASSDRGLYSTGDDHKRYWVGGTGNWSDNTNHWSYSSGGSPGATLPTSADNVYFDANSGTGTVTFDTTANCLDFDASASSVTTFAGTSELNVYGNFSVVSGATWSATGDIVFKATDAGHTIATNSVSLSTSRFKFDGVNGYWTLADNLTCKGVTFTNGTFDTGADRTVNASNLNWYGPGTCAAKLNASTINLTGNTSAIAFSTTSGFTLDAGTSQINIGATGGSCNLSDRTYYNLTFQTVTNQSSIGGSNTFNNLTITGPASSEQYLNLGGNQTVTGTFTVAGNSVTNRVLIKSSLIGTPRTITAAAVSLTNVDFQDITGAGSATWSGTSVGNALGNSNITFTTPVTRYWVATSGGNWSDTTSWSDSSGGSSGSSVPLCHDTVVFDANSITSASRTITADMPRLGADISFASVANSPTLNSTIAVSIYGDLTLSSSMTITSATNTFFYKRGVLNLTQNGTKLTTTTGRLCYFYLYGGSLTLSEDLLSDGAVDFRNGVINFNGYDVTVGSCIFNNPGTGGEYDAYLGSGTITVTRGNFEINSSIHKTNVGTASVVYGGSYASATSYRVVSTSIVIDSLVIESGRGTVQFTFESTIKDLTVGAGCSLQFYAGRTTTFSGTVDLQGASGNLITIRSTSTTNGIVNYTGSGLVTTDYIDIDYITGTPDNTWYVGTHSTDGGHNSQIYFTDGPLTGDSDRLIYTTGSALAYTDRGIYLVGLSPGSSIRGVYTGGSMLNNSERSLYIKGISTDSSGRSIHTSGSVTSSSNRGLYTIGGIVENSIRGLYSIGNNSTNSTRGVYTRGSLTNSSIRGIYSVGGGITGSERGIYSISDSAGSSSRSVYSEGRELADSTRSVYTMATAEDSFSWEVAADLEADNTPLLNSFDAQDYLDVATDDDTFVCATGNNTYFKVLFNIFNENLAKEVFSITWKGKALIAPSSSVVKLQVYNRDTSAWVDLDSNNTAGSEVEFTLSGSISTNPEYYYDDNYIISCRVYQ